MTPGENPFDRARRWYQLKPVALRRFLAVNTVVYVVYLILRLFSGQVATGIAGLFALNPALGEVIFRPWQVITYGFLHLDTGLFGVLHILFNMLWLVWIGQEYEDLYGARRMTYLYLGAGVAGALLTILLHGLFPTAAAFDQTVYGATASVVGVITAVATLYPQKQIGLFLIGVVPLRMILLIFLVLDVLLGFRGGTFFASHLGAALFGYLFARTQRQGVDVGSWMPGFSRQASREQDVSAPPASDEGVMRRLENWLSGRGGQAERRTPKRGRERDPGKVPADSLQQEVDRILDKISESGYDSLTEEEKRILYEASQG